MNTIKTNLILFFLLNMLSCNTSDEIVPHNNTLKSELPNMTSAIYLPANDSITQIFSPLYLINGESFTINRKTTGCFSFLDETIIVARIKDQYVVTFKKTEGSQTNSIIVKKEFDSTFTESLLNFSRYYQNVLRNHKDTDKKDNLSIGTINSLTIQKGFHPVYLSDISVEYLKGYATLIKIIDPYKKY